MNETKYVLYADSPIYSLYNFDTKELLDTFRVSNYDYLDLKQKILNSTKIVENIKLELFKDWEYATETKLERNGGYIFNVSSMCDVN